MNIWVLILLCVVQGLTEFLPVSSSGHLLLVEQLFGVSENLMLLNLFLHISTLLAVVIVYRKTILKILKKKIGEELAIKKYGIISSKVSPILNYTI